MFSYVIIAFKRNIVMTLFEFINKTFSEDNGNPSSMRLITFIIIVVVLFNWTYHNIQTGTISALSYQEILALLGPLGIKAYQKGSEVKPDNENK